MTLIPLLLELASSIKRAVTTPAPQALSRIIEPAGWVGSRPQLESRAWAGGPVAVSAAYWAVRDSVKFVEPTVQVHRKFTSFREFGVVLNLCHIVCFNVRLCSARR